ncbi:MAG: hypothetical protein JWO68_238 [Actinomycetia bacterium]|nr:hypothetical protein [Actinomycetes bacterium]
MRRHDERGSVLVIAMVASVVLAIIGASLMRGTFADLDQSARSQATNRSLQVAEAGINDYIAKLTEDHQYYAHRTHAGEATRRNSTTGTLVAKGQAWDGTLGWTYPNGSDGWYDLGDGVEYDLRVFPPVEGRPTVRIVATGRQVGDPGSAHTLEAFVRTASIVDYQMISDASIVYGATAITDGKIYSKFDVDHGGTVNADIYAEGRIYGRDALGNRLPTTPPNYSQGAKGYDNRDVGALRDVVGPPIEFSNFTGSLIDLQRAAASGGIDLNDPTIGGWWLEFTSIGTVVISKCQTVSMTATATPTTCAVWATRPMPVNGAIAVAQTAIVSGVVKGRVTVGGAGIVAVGANLSNDKAGTDVIGLMGQAINIPAWVTGNFDWTAATLAMDGLWTSVGAGGTGGHMNFTGSTATKLGGAMSQFATRHYAYDKTLQYLQPPYFPVLENGYTIQQIREIPNP